jgi:hypothetical protein
MMIGITQLHKIIRTASFLPSSSNASQAVGDTKPKLAISIHIIESVESIDASTINIAYYPFL